MTEQQTCVNYSVLNRVATIELNRPQALNAFNQQMRRELSASIDRAEADSEVRVVVITGAGKGFSSGADLREGMAGYATIEEQILEEYKPFLSAINQSSKIYIGAVQGAVAGIGSALAMTCDLLLMAESAYIYQAFAAIGLIPDGGATWHLVNTLGYKRAFELIVTADRLDAARCVELGLANRVVPDVELCNQAQQWAEQLASGAPLAQQYIKELLNRAQRQELTNTLDLEAKRQNVTIGSCDYQEGVAAFFEKRPAQFKGH